jgi:hypothetical protein
VHMNIEISSHAHHTSHKDNKRGNAFFFDDDKTANQAFVMRMEADVAKRDNDKRLNEMKKTPEGLVMLKRLGMLKPPAAKPLGARGNMSSFCEKLAISLLAVLSCQS